MEKTRDVLPSPRLPATARPGRRVVLLAGLPVFAGAAVLVEPAVVRIGCVAGLAGAAYAVLGPGLMRARELLDGHPGKGPAARR
jgi:hypothetical protein